MKQIVNWLLSTAIFASFMELKISMIGLDQVWGTTELL